MTPMPCTTPARPRQDQTQQAPRWLRPAPAPRPQHGNAVHPPDGSMSSRRLAAMLHVRAKTAPTQVLQASRAPCVAAASLSPSPARSPQSWLRAPV